jgi:hypothetical protein
MDWKIFLTTLGTIFLAEIGDKTQLATILMTSKTGRPLAVFGGAVLALSLVTLIERREKTDLDHPQAILKKGRLPSSWSAFDVSGEMSLLVLLECPCYHFCCPIA